MEMIAALAFVDYVTWFDEDDPRQLIRLIRPDVHVNGSEYGKDCIEASTLEECGGALHLVDRIPGLATSTVIKAIKNLC
jgi:bifunctional ADP-heptose synthase (sugar kinase/adenylyltransferase)